jgi:hypothetical protein
MAVQNNNLGSPSQSVPTLAAWQLPARGQVNSRYMRWLAAVTACVGLLLFVATVLDPFQLAKPRVLLIAPNAVVLHSNLLNADPQVLGLDRRREQALAQLRKLSSTEDFIYSDSSLFAASPAAIRATLRANIHARGPVIVYVTGVLHASPQGCMLCESSSAAHKAQGLQLSSFITELAASGANGCILCIEAALDTTTPVSKLTPKLDWILCREEVERHLKTLSASSMAVYLIPADEGITTDAGAWVNALTSAIEHYANRKHSPVSLQELVVAITQRLDCDIPWLFTPAWGARPVVVHLPRTLSAANGTSSTEASQAEESPPAGKLVSLKVPTKAAAVHFGGANLGTGQSPTQSLSQFNAWVLEADCAELLEYGWQVHNRWQRTNLSWTDDPSGATEDVFMNLESVRLLQPAPETDPQRWHQFESSLVVATQLLKFESHADSLRTKLRDMALALAVLDFQSLEQPMIPLADSAPAWAKAYWQQQRELVSANRFDHSLWFARRRGAAHSERVTPYIHGLRQLLKPDTSEVHGASLVAAWQLAPAASTTGRPPVEEFIELQWATLLLGTTGLSWEARQGLLRNKLLSLELSCEYVESYTNFPAWRAAEQSRLRSEELALASLPEQKRALTRESIAQITRQLQACQRHLQARQRAGQMAARLCSELPTWDRVLIPGDDRQLDRDPLFRCLTSLTELAGLLKRCDVELTAELKRVTDELSGMRQNWQVVVERATQEPNASHVDMGAYLCSALPSPGVRLKQVVQPSGIPQHSPLSHAKIWTKVKRQSAFIDLLQNMACTRDALHPNRSSDAQFRRDLRDVERMCQTSRTSTEELWNALSALANSRQRWLLEFTESFDSQVPIGYQNLCARVLLTEMELNWIPSDQPAQNLAGRMMVEANRSRAQFSVEQLEYADQRSAALVLKEFQIWNRWLMEQGQTPIVDPLQDLSISLVERLDLSTVGQQTVPVRIENRSSRSQQVDVGAKFDSQRLECRLRPTTSVLVPRQVGPSVSPDDPAVNMDDPQRDLRRIQRVLAANSVQELELEVTVESAGSAQSEIVLDWGTAAGRRKYVVRAEVARDPWVSVQLRNQNSSFGTQPATSVDVLWANRSNALAIELTNRRADRLEATAAVYAVNHGFEQRAEGRRAVQQVPQGVIEKSHLDAWLATQPVQLLLERSPPFVLQPHQTQQLKLPAVATDPLQPAVAVHQLWIVVFPAGSEQAQLIALSPRVARPAAYVAPKVSYDVDSMELRIDVSLVPEQTLPMGMIELQAKLSSLDTPAETTLATAQLSTHNLAETMLIKLKPANLDSQLLRIDVDGWPNAFVYRIDTSHSQPSIPLAHGVQAIGAQEVSQRTVLDSSQAEVAIEVEAMVSDGHWAPSREEISVGLDLNRDRLLLSEPSVGLSSPIAAEVSWQGSNPAGCILLQSRIRRPVVNLAVSPTWNQAAAILARVERDGSTLWSNSQPLIIDHQAPRVLSVAAAGGQPSRIGKPMDIQVRVNDGQLSGVSRVRGTWSLAGSTKLDASAQVVEGVKLGIETWSLNMPTAELHSGSSLLLIQAVDAAGNSSEVVSEFIEVLDDAAYVQYQRSITTTITGRVMLGAQPQSALTIELSSPNADGVTRKTQTNARGEFSLDKVPSGSYQMSMAGIVRGMRITRYMAVEVAAPQAPPPLIFRLDRPDASPTKEAQ